MQEQPNYSYIHQLSGGDKDFEKELMNVVKIELPEEVTSYKKYLENNDFQRAADTVHKIKHKISILGLEKSYQIAIDYENELREQKKGLETKFNEILNVMVTFIAKA